VQVNSQNVISETLALIV